MESEEEKNSTNVTKKCHHMSTYFIYINLFTTHGLAGMVLQTP